MSYWQVTATLANGATVTFGVEAPDEPGAVTAAGEGLSEFPQLAGQVDVRLLDGPGDR